MLGTRGIEHCDKIAIERIIIIRLDGNNGINRNHKNP